MVLNAGDHHPETVHQANTALAAYLNKLQSRATQTNTTVHVVDRYSPGKRIPEKQGVGLARKTGTDLALRLFRQGQIENPMLLQTDADAVLPNNYFTALRTQSGGAQVFRHQHFSTDPVTQMAADLYDLHQRYYEAGLAFAGSRYAYPSLGSCLAIHAETYAQVRGFPRRSAGEDFYLLNKTVKIAQVQINEEIELRLQARLSERVPFGTGPALAARVGQLSEDPDKSANAIYSYHPEVFDELKRCLKQLRIYAQDRRPVATVFTATQQAALNALGFERFAQKLHTRYPQAEQRVRMTNDWFDGLRTLRFIHLQEQHWHKQPLLHTVALTPWAQALPIRLMQRAQSGKGSGKNTR